MSTNSPFALRTIPLPPNVDIWRCRCARHTGECRWLAVFPDAYCLTCQDVCARW